MRNILIPAAVLASLLAFPSVASAGDTTTGVVGGAIAGGVVGGPVGAVVGGAVGGTIGAASDDQRRREERREIDRDPPTVEQRTCVTHSDGTRECREISR